jgi:hypothetical protein
MASANPMNLRGGGLLATFAMSFLKVLKIYIYKKTFSKLRGNGGIDGKTVMTAEVIKKFSARLPYPPSANVVQNKITQ